MQFNVCVTLERLEKLLERFVGRAINSEGCYCVFRLPLLN